MTAARDVRTIETDVLVVGGGTAGFAAALAAARAGGSVNLVEATTRIGGVMAFCPGMPWGGGYPLGCSIGGIFEELASRLLRMTPPAAERRPCALDSFGAELHYDPEEAAFAMSEMLDHAGARTRLNTIVGEPLVNDDRIIAVSAQDRLGSLVFRPHVVIDCSGDGDLSARAGIPFTLGDASGRMMAVSLTFHMVGVDAARAFSEGDPYFRRHAAAGIAEGLLHPDLHKLYLMRGFHPGAVFCNTVTIRGVNGADPDEVAGATREGRRRCREVARFLTARVPGFENAQMWALGPTVGVRETRKLQAIYRMTGDDIARGARFEDGIVACDNPIDDVMRGCAGMTHEAAVGAGQYYTIPLRCLIPRSITNLLFAGRLVSADPVAFASLRGMPQCMAMGQAAGVAASVALAHGIAVQQVQHAAVVAELRACGVNGIGGQDLTASVRP